MKIYVELINAVLILMAIALIKYIFTGINFQS